MGTEFKMSQEKREYYRKYKQKYRNEGRDRTEKDKEYMKKYIKEYRKKAREKVFLHYGSRCVCCNETKIEFLTIDHINGGGRQHRKKIGVTIDNWLVANDFPRGFQILCFNCNQAKAIYGECPHKYLNK